MAMKGHKRNCKCVGCSAATRRKGMKKLGISKGKARKNPSTRKAAPKKRTTTRKAAPKKRTTTRKAAPKKRATRAASTRSTTRKNPAPCRCPRMPKASAGAYLVLATVGGKMRPIKEFSRLREAEDFAKNLPDGARAIVTQVKSTWG